MQKIKRSDDLDTEITSLYATGLTTYQISKKIGCSQTFVMNCLKRHNVLTRSTSSYNTKYITNINFFKLIDSQEKAYFLGLLYADGNNYIRRNHSYEVSIKLKSQDKLILEKFRDYICPSLKLKELIDKKTNNKHVLLKINSKELSNQLTNLGCIPNKSLKLTFPIINEYLIHHFIRGYFDGDGSLYSRKQNKTGYVNYGWQITSTKMFCHSVKNYLDNLSVNSSIKLACPKTNNITCTLSVGGNKQITKLLDWLYKDSQLHLHRKYNKYLKLKTP